MMIYPGSAGQGLISMGSQVQILSLLGGFFCIFIHYFMNILSESSDDPEVSDVGLHYSRIK